MDSAMKRRKSAGEIFRKQLVAKQEQTLTKEDNLLRDDCELGDLVENSSPGREIDLREEPALDIEQLNLELEELSLDIEDIPPPPEVISIGSSFDKDISMGDSLNEEIPVKHKLIGSYEEAWAAAQEFGLPLIDIESIKLQKETIKKIDEKFLRKHNLLPLFERGERLFVAISDPTNLIVLDEINVHTKKNTEAVLVEEDKLNKVIERALEAFDDSMGGLKGSLMENSFDEEFVEGSLYENPLEYSKTEYEKKLATEINNFFSSDISSLGEDQAELQIERKQTFLPDPSLPQSLGIQNPMSDDKLLTSEELQLEKEPIQVRETGFRFWKRVIVPPNAYVVHTRLGHKEPITLGLGMSFRYNPAKDAYFVVPAVMQTIGIVANCMTREKQGINLLAYLQWRIDNFSIAYRKLDFSNPRDPLGVVNAQLREQAEATIKDKISTMGVEEVLTDKSPIIEELTTRLKEVTEGRTQDKEVAGGEGLGIKIVTVQIREALVSSKSLWQNLQAPYRHQQEKIARISLLMTQNEVRQKEQESRQYTETSQAETTLAIERIKQTKQTEMITLKLAEEIIRVTKEQETQLKKIQLDEQLNFAQQESKQRLEIQMRTVEQEKELIALKREHAKILEQTKLDMERQAQQKTLHTEQMLHTLTEESRLAEMTRQTQREKLEKERSLQQEIASFELFVQEQKHLIAAKEQEALLSHQRRAHLSQLELEKETQQFRAIQKERDIALERLTQEARNVISASDLKRRLIEILPQLFAEMPDIHELKILQMKEGNMTLEMFIAFLEKMLAITDEWDMKTVVATDSLQSHG